jgi:phosphoglycerate kinase
VLRLPGLEDLPDIDGRSVLVRADLNVPLKRSDRGEIVVADDFRIRAVLPTLRWLAERGGRVTVCSHLGRPGGHPDERFSMGPVRRRLEELCAPAGFEVQVMENLRFDPGEEANDPDFVDRLVDGHDLYVNDAFGAAHRAHASIVGPPRRVPSAAGRLLCQEVEVISSLFERPEPPLVAVVGGAKVSDKLPLLEALLDQVDTLLVGGGMCFTFLAASDHQIGDSLVEADQVGRCRDLLRSGKDILLPVDLIAEACDGTIGPSGRPALASCDPDIPRGWRGTDIGERTGELFAERIELAGSVLWNGPMGVYEDPRFAWGTRSVAEAVSSSSAFSVVGGGDTVAAVETLGLGSRIGHLSSGGGAALELIEKGDLPGLAALRGAPESVSGRSRTAPVRSGLI